MRLNGKSRLDSLKDDGEDVWGQGILRNCI